MRTTARLSLVLAVVATAGLVAVPVVDAKPQSSALSKFEKRQNARIAKAKARIDALRAIAVALGQKNAQQDGANAQQDVTLADVPGLKSTVALIVAGVPDIVSGLTQLKDGLTAAGAGLTTLGSAYQAVEYGVAKVSATNATVAAGGSITSSDVPDDGNSAVGNGTAILVATGSPVAVDLKADIRSNEGDNGAGATVGQAGGFVYVKGTQQTFTDNDADVDPGGGVVAANRDGAETVVQRVACGGAPNPPGIFGTVAGDSIVTPTGTVTNLPLKNLPGGIARTDTTHPDASSTSLLPATCQFAATPGAVYEVYYNVNFVDIPTSTTPGPTE
jgi:hypothetical protein